MALVGDVAAVEGIEPVSGVDGMRREMLVIGMVSRHPELLKKPGLTVGKQATPEVRSKCCDAAIAPDV